MALHTGHWERLVNLKSVFSFQPVSTGLRLEKNMDLVDVILPYASELLDEASVKFFDKCVSKAHLEKNQTCKRMRRKCSLISVCIVIPHNWRVF